MELDEIVKFMIPMRKIYKEYGEEGKYLSEEELINILIREGYANTREKAESIIRGCEARSIILICYRNSERYTFDQRCFKLLTEDDLIESEEESLEELYEHRRKWEVKKYVLREDEYIDPNNSHERRVREIYAEKNKKILTEEELTQELIKKGYREEEAKNMLNKGTSIKGVLTSHLQRVDGRKVWTYEIMSPCEWDYEYYISRLRRGEDGEREGVSESAAGGVRYLDIKNVFREHLEKTGKASMRHDRLVEEIMRRCEVKRSVAEEAISYALLEHKIRYVSFEKVPREQEEYWWFGTSVMVPASIEDDVEFKELREIFQTAEKEGKKALRREELIDRMVDRFCSSSHTFTESILDDAESLFKIEKAVEDGKTVYRWIEKVKAGEEKFLR